MAHEQCHCTEQHNHFSIKLIEENKKEFEKNGTVKGPPKIKCEEETGFIEETQATVDGGKEIPATWVKMKGDNGEAAEHAVRN